MLFHLAFGELLICWVVWCIAFVGARKQAAGQKKAGAAPASRWGIFLQSIGFALTWAYVRLAGFEKFEAALNEDHELVQTGPYRWVRHPIYASMLGMLLAIGFAWTWWPMQLGGLVFFLIGTEIRVRSEDRLLSERFGDSFAAYHSRVPAYIPFIR